MKTNKFLIVLAFLFLLPAVTYAAWERTVSAWDTQLPGAGKVQISFWSNYWASESNGTDAEDTMGSVYINYGVTDNWAVCVSPSLYGWKVDGGDSESGISDTTLMTTYLFLDESEDFLDLAIIGIVDLPTGDEDKYLGSGSVEPGITLIASKTFGPIIAVANVGGYTIIDSREGEKDFVLSAILEGVYPVNDKFSLNASIATWTARWDSSDSSSEAGLGARFNLSKELFLAGMFYESLSNDYDWSATLAVGFEF